MNLNIQYTLTLRFKKLEEINKIVELLDKYNIQKYVIEKENNSVQTKEIKINDSQQITVNSYSQIYKLSFINNDINLLEEIKNNV